MSNQVQVGQVNVVSNHRAPKCGRCGSDMVLIPPSTVELQCSQCGSRQMGRGEVAPFGISPNGGDVFDSSPKPRQEEEVLVCATHGLKFVMFAGGPVCPHDLPGYRVEKEHQVGTGEVGVE